VLVTNARVKALGTVPSYIRITDSFYISGVETSPLVTAFIIGIKVYASGVCFLMCDLIVINLNMMLNIVLLWMYVDSLIKLKNALFSCSHSRFFWCINIVKKM
jgi:flagellar biosynthesis protein FliP